MSFELHTSIMVFVKIGLCEWSFVSLNRISTLVSLPSRTVVLDLMLCRKSFQAWADFPDGFW